MLRQTIATLAVAALVAVASSSFAIAADEKPQLAASLTPATTPTTTLKAPETLVWGTDFAAAKKAAADQKKPILAFFTGSDWCIWCVRLEDEVFSQTLFKKYATDKYVLFMADFPQKKKLPAEVKKQNDELAQTYKIEGYPTVLVLDATGKKLAETGYEKGGAEPWIKALDQALVGKISASPAPAGAK